jgi:translocation and assembly module TamA
MLLGLFLISISVTSFANEYQLKFSVTGVKDEPNANVISVLKNQQGLLTYPLTIAEVHRFYDLAPKAIEKALQPYGYFKPTLISTITENNGNWLTNFAISPGPRMYVTSLDIRVSGPGQNDPEFLKLVRDFPVKLNTPLNINLYDAAKNDLFKIASTRGYFTAKISTSRVIIDLNTYQAKIIIHFSTGERFRFGETHFNPSPFALSFLQRFQTYHSGEYYDYAKLQRTQQYFVTSNYFTQTLVTPDLDAAKQKIVPIEIHLIPQKSEQFIYGLGYGTDTGVRGTVGINLRRLNQYGHHLNFLSQLSTSSNESITANYYIPGKNPARDQYILSAGVGHIEIKNHGGDIKSTNGKLSAGYSTYLGEVQQTLALTYLNERYIIPNFNLPYINSNALYPSGTWQYISTDKTFQPTRGISLYGIISYAPWKEITGLTFFQARFRVRTLFTVFHNTRILMRADVGHTSISDLTQLPLSLQLLAGGANSIRGFSFDSIGPGKNLIVGSAEIQQRIKGDWYIGAFIDAGTVTNTAPIQNPYYFLKSLNAGAGPALIWVSPVGTLEASIARSVNSHQKGWHFAFSMGQDL